MPRSETQVKKSVPSIQIQGARVHNLKNVDVEIPRNKFVVITGVSGSGKSSLAFDTLYAEGQRRYVESLSSYARQFMGRLEKPDVDKMTGISPAVAIEQKVTSRNPRSTVGTITEIYDHLKLLYARIGKTFSPISGDEVRCDSIDDVIAALTKFPVGTAVIIENKVNDQGRAPKEVLEVLQQQGFARVRSEKGIERIDDVLESGEFPEKFALIVDRIKLDPEDEDTNARLADSLQTAFYEGHGVLNIEVLNEDKSEMLEFSDRFEADGMVFEKPSLHFFSFNDPFGACKKCEGFGTVIGIDPETVIPDQSLSVYEGAVAPWKGEKMSKWRDKFITASNDFDFPIHRAVRDMDPEHLELLWNGNKKVKGIKQFFKYVEEKSYKIQYRVMLSRYRGKTTCPDCNGRRLRKDADYVKISGSSISELVAMPVKKLQAHFETIKLNEHEQEIAKRLLKEIRSRLKYLLNVGLGYLSLDRVANTLSGGESQRIHLATSLGSSLVGSMYILDEPSIGLHPRDTQRLISVLKDLRDLGNTVIVVEHDEEVMLAADHIIDMGPLAGAHGGELVFAGDGNALQKAEGSLTAQYLTGKLQIPVPTQRRSSRDAIKVLGARQNDLKNINVSFPLHVLTVVTGVSGSGKSTLVSEILYPALNREIEGYGKRAGDHDGIDGEMEKVKAVEFIDQDPIGRSSRSNPVTYVKAYDDIRALFAARPKSKTMGLTPASFSFNVAGGRCDQCEGEGQVKIEMQFMADIKLSCESCKGKRFKDEVLEVTYKEKNIADILNLTVDQAMELFDEDESLNRKILKKLKPLQDVGLGYVHLGQSSSTLSGGEAQRVKLAAFISKGKNAPHTLFIFDEPTTGLHFHDIQKLLDALNALIAQGHTVIMIEHNMDMIKCADHIIDLGPEGGEGGGNVLFEGTPEEMVSAKGSYTAEYLARALKPITQLN